jgi:hypothetical protein
LTPRHAYADNYVDNEIGGLMSAAIKQQIIDLVDEVPEQAQAILLSVVRHLTSPDAKAFVTAEDAPYDDEPVTPEDVAAIEEGKRAVARGEFITQAELRRKLGI